MTSYGPRTLHEGPETPTEWKTETESDQWTDQPTGAGARDAYASNPS